MGICHLGREQLYYSNDILISAGSGFWELVLWTQSLAALILIIQICLSLVSYSTKLTFYESLCICNCVSVCVQVAYIQFANYSTVCDVQYLFVRVCLLVRKMDMMTHHVFSDPVLSCFPETQWGHFNNSVGQASESPALCGILPARQRPANGSRPLPLCHSVPQGVWGLKLC